MWDRNNQSKTFSWTLSQSKLDFNYNLSIKMFYFWVTAEGKSLSRKWLHMVCVRRTVLSFIFPNGSTFPLCPYKQPSHKFHFQNLESIQEAFQNYFSLYLSSFVEESLISTYNPDLFCSSAWQKDYLEQVCHGSLERWGELSFGISSWNLMFSVPVEFSVWRELSLSADCS